MMKFIFLVSFALFGAQQQRFYYEHSYFSDSLQFENMQHEVLYLDASKRGSVFYSSEILKSDSLRSITVKGFKIPYPKADFKNIIKYDNVKGQLINYQYPYAVVMDTSSPWKIDSETKTVFNYFVQKATKKIKGRTWTAWFTTEIPLSYGPYLLQGLPGLIVLAEDEKQTHRFILSGIKKLETFDFDKIPSIPNVGRLKTVTSEAFREIYRNQIENPQSQSTGERSRFFDVNGKEISETEFYRNIKLNAAAARKNNNNKLVYDFLKE